MVNIINTFIIMTLGEKIKQFRKQRSFSLRQMEKITGIKKDYLCRIETSVLKNPTYKTLYTISKGSEIDIAELFETAPYVRPVIKIVSHIEQKGQAKSKNLLAIPIISQQAACQEAFKTPLTENQCYGILSQSYLPNIEQTSNCRLLYHNSEDSSMEPVIPAGALMCVDFGDQKIEALENKITLIKHNDNTCKIGYLKFDSDSIIILPHDKFRYSPIIFPLSQQNVRILGKVIGCFSL